MIGTGAAMDVDCTLGPCGRLVSSLLVNPTRQHPCLLPSWDGALAENRGLAGHTITIIKLAEITTLKSAPMTSSSTTICPTLPIPAYSALTVVVEQLLDQVDMGEHHSSAAVTLEPEIIQRVALVVVRLKQAQVRLPLVPDYLPTREASNRDDHGG